MCGEIEVDGRDLSVILMPVSFTKTVLGRRCRHTFDFDILYPVRWGFFGCLFFDCIVSRFYWTYLCLFMAKGQQMLEVE